MKLNTPLVSGKGKFGLPSTRNILTGASGTTAFTPFSVAACWCPFDVCTPNQNVFVQQIGIRYAVDIIGVDVCVSVSSKELSRGS